MGRGQNNQVSDLQDLVTEALAPDTEEPKAPEYSSLIEKITSRGGGFSAIDALADGRETEKFLYKADPVSDAEEVRVRVANWAASIVKGRSYFVRRKVGWNPVGAGDISSESFFMLNDYLSNPSKENLRGLYYFVRGYNNALECYTLTNNIDNTKDYLEERWKEETAQRMHELTGTSIATTKKWVAGSKPSDQNMRELQRVTEIIYTLENDCWMSPTEAQAWLHTQAQEVDGETPWQRLSYNSGAWTLDQGVTQALERTFQENN